jgi:uncharacterized protein (TIGR02246 family)
MSDPGHVAVADRLALLDAYARLAVAIDAGDAVGWAACFAPGGLIRTSRGQEIRGRAALERFAREWRASRTAQPRHVTWHHLVRRDGDALASSCYAAVLTSHDGAVRTEMTAVYRDRFVPSPDGAGWLLEERTVTAD